MPKFALAIEGVHLIRPAATFSPERRRSRAGARGAKRKPQRVMVILEIFIKLPASWGEISRNGWQRSYVGV